MTPRRNCQDVFCEDVKWLRCSDTYCNIHLMDFQKAIDLNFVLKENRRTLLLSFQTEMSLFRCHSKTRTFKNLTCYFKLKTSCCFFSKDGFKSHKPSVEVSLTNTPPSVILL